MGEAKRRLLEASGHSSGPLQESQSGGRTQYNNHISNLDALNEVIAKYVEAGDLFAAAGICGEAMDQFKNSKQQSLVLKTALILAQLPFKRSTEETFLPLANAAIKSLGRHSLHSKELCRAIGYFHEIRLNFQEASKWYIGNVETYPDEAAGWQDLLRTLSALSVAGVPDTLRLYLCRLHKQGKKLFRSVIAAVLESIEGSRPEDFYLLASHAHDIMPDDLSLWWFWISAMSFVERENPQEITSRTEEWARKFISLQPYFPPVQRLEPVTGRRIRIGYIASKLHMMFLFNHVQYHDFDRFDILFFTDDPNGSADFLGPHVTITRLGPGDPTLLLRQARLDIAIEMMGPSFRANWRGIEGFAAFTRRIAPVQCHWISTTSTYGTKSGFDYLLADEKLVPVALEHLYVEKIKRLRNVAHCWAPVQGEAITAAPVTANRFVTFGSANRGTKLTRETLHRWGRIVAAVPDSKMIIKGKHVRDLLFRTRALEIFSKYGVQDRLVFADATQWPEWPGDFYSQIDISLDSYPFGGGITTLESLWNGVPVITLRGSTFVSRLAADYLDLIGKGCWVADTGEDFFEIAVKLAMEHHCIAETRSILQARLASSPLLDGRSFARDLEIAFLEMLEGS